MPYNRRTCTEIGAFAIEGVAVATGATYIAMRDNVAIAGAIEQANATASQHRPVIVDVSIDYSKRTAFTTGAGRTTFGRLPLRQKARVLARAISRRILS